MFLIDLSLIGDSVQAIDWANATGLGTFKPDEPASIKLAGQHITLLLTDTKSNCDYS